MHIQRSSSALHVKFKVKITDLCQTLWGHAIQCQHVKVLLNFCVIVNFAVKGFNTCALMERKRERGSETWQRPLLPQVHCILRSCQRVKCSTAHNVASSRHTDNIVKCSTAHRVASSRHTDNIAWKITNNVWSINYNNEISDEHQILTLVNGRGLRWPIKLIGRRISSHCHSFRLLEIEGNWDSLKLIFHYFIE